MAGLQDKYLMSILFIDTYPSLYSWAQQREMLFLFCFLFLLFYCFNFYFFVFFVVFFSFGLKYVDSSYEGKSFAQKLITSSEDNQNEKFPRRESNPGRGGESAES